jgi:hypothetical protein
MTKYIQQELVMTEYSMTGSCNDRSAFLTTLSLQRSETNAAIVSLPKGYTYAVRKGGSHGYWEGCGEGETLW